MDPTRVALLRALERLSECFPDLRFGQMIANLSYWAKGPHQGAIWDATDEELLQECLKKLESPSE